MTNVLGGWRIRIVLLVLFCSLRLVWEFPVGAQTPLPSNVSSSGEATAAATITGTSPKLQLEDEVRRLKTMVKQLSIRVEELSATLSTRSAVEGPGTRADRETSGVSTDRAGGPVGLPDISGSSGGSAAPRGPLEPRRTGRFNMPGLALDLPARVNFGPGFQIQTDDNEFQIQLHDLTQFDGRFYLQGEQQPIHGTYVIPREWVILAGRLTRPFEYYVAVAEGIDNLNLLDAYLNVNFDSRLQFKVGRYKTPFTYEFYALGINSFPTPERSLFYNNFGPEPRSWVHGIWTAFRESI